MTEDELRELIDKRMKEYNFENCYIHITKSIKTLGSVIYSRNTNEISFTFSCQLAKAKPGVAENAILHEIAHGLDILRRGHSDHGPEWQRVCMEIGAKPRAKVLNAFDQSIWRFSIICDTCNKVIAKRHRISQKDKDSKWKRSYCVSCGPQSKLIIVDSGQKL